MEGVLEWGIGIIQWWQRFSPALDLPFRAFTFMGEEEFFLILIPLVYWCLDRRIGARMTMLFLVSSYLNAVAKTIGSQPRPADYAPDRVIPLWDAGGYGLPSGHTQGAVVIWGYLASQFRRTWLWVVAALLMVLIPLSRVYLGVHFPTDLLGGYVLGALILLLYLWLEPGVEQRLVSAPLGWQLALASAGPLLLALVFLTEDGVTTSATLMGMGVGFILERRWVGFSSGGRWWRCVLRFLLGAAGLLALWMGLRVAFSGLEPALLLRFVRYGLVGLWGALGAPWVFVKLRLADTG